MKKRYLTSLVLLCFIPLLTQCASQQEVDTLKYHVRTVNKKLDDMKKNTVGQMQLRQANSSGQLEQLQADILQLRSTLEENSHMNRLLQKQNKELQLAVQNLSTEQQATLNTKLNELNSKIATQKKSLTLMQQERIKEAMRRSKAAKKAANEAMRKAQKASRAPVSNSRSTSGSVHLQPSAKKILIANKPASAGSITINPITTPTQTQKDKKSARKPAVTASKAAAPKVAKVAAPKTSKTVDTLGKAQQKFRDGRYDEAYTLFQKHASSSKGSRTTALTSRYMMGECLFKQNKYDQSIIQYQQIISNAPGSQQAAKALLRQGEAFEQLSDNETARMIYKKILSSYGSSPEAAEAKKKISSL